MIRGLFRLLFSLVGFALVVLVLTAIWMVYDGSTDVGQRADFALVPGHEDVETGAPGPLVKARLDRAIELYRADQVSHLLISGGGKLEGYDEASMMVRYLEEHGIPSSAITGYVEDTAITDWGADTQKVARHWARFLKENRPDSVMLVTQYYQMTRWKLALKLAGVTQIEQAHVGQFDKADLLGIGHEVIAFYGYLGTSYFLPEAKELSEKAKVEGEKAKETIDKKLDSLSK